MAKKQQISFAIVILMSFLLIKCANQLPPTGGPEDTEPPVILSLYPENGTVNYTDNYFEIEFSEYVDKRSVQDAIFISPAIENLDYDWSGTTLRVDFLDTLRKNTTYVFAIGTELYDLNNSNNMEEAYTFAFSTGNKIDTYQITGRVYADDPNGIMIFGYKAKDTVDINPIQQEPDYISQVGKAGDYKLLGLGEGSYRIFAIKDQFRDNLYGIGDDEFGAPFREINLSTSDSIFIGMNFQLSREDTTKPQLVSAAMTDKNHIMIELSEYIDSTKLSCSNFYIIDSTDNREINLKQFFKGQAKDLKYYLTLSDSLNPESEFFLFSDSLNDGRGNKSGIESISLVANDKPDTTAPIYKSSKTQYPDSKIGLENSYLIIDFKDGIMKKPALSAFEFLDLKEKKYQVSAEFIDDASIKLNIESKLKNRTDYKLKIDYNKIIDLAGNKLDSIFTVSTSTINDLDFSGVSGKVISKTDNTFVVLKNTESKKYKYSSKTVKGQFDIQKVVPGKYLVWAFEDGDSNGVYSNGKVYPFKESEKFGFYSDTLNLRARWPVGDVLIKIN